MPSSHLDWNISRTTVRVSKPAALMFAKHPSVQVTRSRADFPTLFSPSSTRAYSITPGSSGSQTLHTAYIGLGTNLGQRVKNLNDAVSTLDRLGAEDGRTKVVETSWMYESDAMYHEEQERFLNAVVKVRSPALASTSPIVVLWRYSLASTKLMLRLARSRLCRLRRPFLRFASSPSSNASSPLSAATFLPSAMARA